MEPSEKAKRGPFAVWRWLYPESWVFSNIFPVEVEGSTTYRNN
jgi:hypothetical protein